MRGGGIRLLLVADEEDLIVVYQALAHPAPYYSANLFFCAIERVSSCH